MVYLLTREKYFAQGVLALVEEINNCSLEERRELALERARELKSYINDYMEAQGKIEAGLNLEDTFKENKKRIKYILNATEEDWQSWQWQIENRIYNVETLAKIINISEEAKNAIKMIEGRYRWAVSPYYLSLADNDNPGCPIRKQSIPSLLEYTNNLGQDDPMAEEFTSPAPAITRRYPDRLIINVTNQCAMYCRHCQRRRNIGELDTPAPREKIEEALKYIRENEELRDILLTGGDAFMLSNEEIDWLLTQLDEIPHVEIKRLGTRTPVTLPMRVDDELCTILEKHAPVYVNVHFNHPKEVTEASRKACFKLAKAGVPLGNQAVLLRDINNDSHVMKKLNHELLKILVKPYYIFHAKGVRGTAHFRTPVEDGIKIMNSLRGHTSGLAIPTFIVNAPEGFGKIPMLSEYIISLSSDKITIRNWENKDFEYFNPHD